MLCMVNLRIPTPSHARFHSQICKQAIKTFRFKMLIGFPTWCHVAYPTRLLRHSVAVLSWGAWHQGHWVCLFLLASQALLTFR
jgi:hypothetical protein